MAQATHQTQQLRAARRYWLRLTDVHGKPYPLTPELLKIAPEGVFELPLAPQSVDYPDAARTALHSLADGTMHADEQGAAVPSVQLTGTFGEGIRANSLGVKLDGRGWQRALESVITFYFEAQRKASAKRSPPAVLEWHDTYRNLHLIVTPKATPRGREDAANPYRETYQLALTGLRRTTAPPKAAHAGKQTALLNACPYQMQCRVDGIAREAGCPHAGGQSA